MTETNVQDFLKGKRERLAGFYDKWYRYNRSDDGAAYDAGVKGAVDGEGCPDAVIIIPCNFL